MAFPNTDLGQLMLNWLEVTDDNYQPERAFIWNYDFINSLQFYLQDFQRLLGPSPKALWFTMAGFLTNLKSVETSMQQHKLLDAFIDFQESHFTCILVRKFADQQPVINFVCFTLDTSAMYDLIDINEIYQSINEHFPVINRLQIENAMNRMRFVRISSIISRNSGGLTKGISVRYSEQMLITTIKEPISYINLNRRRFFQISSITDKLIPDDFVSLDPSEAPKFLNVQLTILRNVLKYMPKLSIYPENVAHFMIGALKNFANQLKLEILPRLLPNKKLCSVSTRLVNQKNMFFNAAYSYIFIESKDRQKKLDIIQDFNILPFELLNSQTKYMLTVVELEKVESLSSDLNFDLDWHSSTTIQLANIGARSIDKIARRFGQTYSGRWFLLQGLIEHILKVVTNYAKTPNVLVHNFLGQMLGSRQEGMEIFLTKPQGEMQEIATSFIIKYGNHAGVLTIFDHHTFFDKNLVTHLSRMGMPLKPEFQQLGVKYIDFTLHIKMQKIVLDTEIDVPMWFNFDLKKAYNLPDDVIDFCQISLRADKIPIASMDDFFPTSKSSTIVRLPSLHHSLHVSGEEFFDTSRLLSTHIDDVIMKSKLRLQNSIQHTAYIEGILCPKFFVNYDKKSPALLQVVRSSDPKTDIWLWMEVYDNLQSFLERLTSVSVEFHAKVRQLVGAEKINFTPFRQMLHLYYVKPQVVNLYEDKRYANVGFCTGKD